ncbi:formin-1-like [Alligator mississippiensis]|uniref:formin-1-like n=1 Tax=Alligator mississippiensis TaxID=8496 RepID=UPI0003D0D47B|nr:formin-1-like [Alligator mississippiensis]
MEGTHTILQLYSPIMELCYVSFYLPEGKVRGFTYKGCVTLDRSRKRFHNCCQVREGSQTAKLREQPSENIGDIFFKQTTTRDILTELYKLTAEKERLVANLLNSRNILGVKMGNQDGKLQDVSGVMALHNEDNMDFKNHQESFLASMDKEASLKNKKTSKFSKRKENMEEFLYKKGREKVHEDDLEPSSVLNRKEIQLGNNRILSNRLPPGSSPSSFSISNWQAAETKDDLPLDTQVQPEKWREAGYFLKIGGPVESDADLSDSLSEYDNEVFGSCITYPTSSLLNDAEGNLKSVKVQHSSPLLNFQQDNFFNRFEALNKTAVAGNLNNCKYAEQTSNKKLAARVVAKVQDLKACVQKVVQTYEASENISYPEFQGNKETGTPILTTVHNEFIPKGDIFTVDDAAVDSKNTTMPEKEQGGSVLQHEGKKAHITDESCNLTGAVNKTVLKVRQSDSLDEAAEWRKLQEITRADRKLPGSMHDQRPLVTQESSKRLFLNLPINISPNISQTNTNLKPEEKRQLSLSLAAVSNILNLHPLSNTQKQMSPIPSPVSSRLSSPQLHHRILPLPTQNAEEESVFSDYCGGRHNAMDFSFARNLESQFHLKFPESGESGFSIRQPSLHLSGTGEHFEKCSILGTLTTQTQQQLSPGLSCFWH